MKEKITALVDGNNFFANCEVLKNPSLKGKPVCVLSNNDGCVIARSNEAKKLGIQMGIPYFKAKIEFPDAIYLSADFETYHDLSRRMTEFLKRYSDKIEIYSIDEAFLDITGLDKIYGSDLKTVAEIIKKETEENTGVCVSVGIANSKVLAKTAAYKAKKINGIYVIEKHLIIPEIENIPVEEIWGIGKNTARKLKSFGIFYADEILLKDDDFYRRFFGKKGLELKYELSGISVIPVCEEAVKPKSIQRTRAFPEFSNNKTYIKTEIDLHLHNTCKKLRENKISAKVIGIMLRTKDFRVFFRCIKSEKGSCSEIELTKIVSKLFDEIYNPEITYRASGIYAGETIPEDNIQQNFFVDEKREKIKRLSEALDKIEDKFGKGSTAVGISGIKSVREKHKRIMNFKYPK